MRYIIKTLSTFKGSVMYEIHKVGCSDIHRDDPIQANEIETDSIESWIANDRGDMLGRDCYKIMDCIK